MATFRKFEDIEAWQKVQAKNLFGLSKSDEISKMINGLITYLKGTEIKGYKFKEDQEYYVE